MADEGLRGRIARQSEDALGKLAQDLLENPLVNGALTRAFDARERASHAQEAALGALNIPTAADVERLTRRLRQVSQRLEGIEDGVDKLDGRFAALKGNDDNPLAAVEGRLGAIEDQLVKLAADVSLLAGAMDAAPQAVPREQERLEVDKPAAAKPTPAKAAAKPGGAKTGAAKPRRAPKKAGS